MKISTRVNQPMQFTARLSDKAVVLDFDRAKAPEAWAKMNANTRGPAPVVSIDLMALAKEHGIEAGAVLAELRKDAYFRELETNKQIEII